MLSLFPIQFLAPLAYLFLRLCVAGVFVYFARTNARATPFAKAALLAEFGIATLLTLGLFTQIGALAAMVYVTVSTMKHTKSRVVSVLIFCAALSLFITGPGIFAFDLPI